MFFFTMHRNSKINRQNSTNTKYYIKPLLPRCMSRQLVTLICSGHAKVFRAFEAVVCPSFVKVAAVDWQFVLQNDKVTTTKEDQIEVIMMVEVPRLTCVFEKVSKHAQHLLVRKEGVVGEVLLRNLRPPGYLPISYCNFGTIVCM